METTEKQAKINLECAIDIAQKGIPLDFDKIAPVLEERGLSQNERIGFLTDMYKKARPALLQRSRELEKEYNENPEIERRYKHKYGLTDFAPIIGDSLNAKRNKSRTGGNLRFYWLANGDSKSRLKAKAFDRYPVFVNTIAGITATSYALHLSGILK